MSEPESTKECTKCKSELLGNFCSNCGLPQTLKRIDGQHIVLEIGRVLNFDKGILFTVRELLLRPGLNIRKFINEDRNRLVRPIVFIIVCSLIYSLVQQFFQFKDGYFNYSFDNDTTAFAIFDWISGNYGYANILIAIFIAFWIKIFFRKYGYNFFEILILLCFVMGMGMLLFSFFGIIDGLTGIKIVDKSFLIGILYISWAIGQFFDKKKFLNYLKAIVSYFLGLMIFSICVILMGFLIDSLK